MISMVQPLAAGNAIRLFLTPPAGAVNWRVLKKSTDSFTTYDDPSAVLVFEGDDTVIVDAELLQNGATVCYRPFYYDGTAWTAGATALGTPAASYEENTTDVLSFMRDRIEAGLVVEVQRGNVLPDAGFIQVYTAPPSLERDLRFPLVTIHLESETSAERGLGEDISGDEFDLEGFAWSESEGWLAQVQLTIVAWSLNSDERIELRKCIRRIIIANMPVLATRGIIQVNLTQQDVDAVNGEFGAPVYQVMSSFSCLAPVRVSDQVGAIRVVTSTNNTP